MATQEKRKYTEQKKTPLKQPSPRVPGEARLISLCPQTRLGSCGQPMASVCAKSRVGWTRGDGDARRGIRALCSSPGKFVPGAKPCSPEMRTIKGAMTSIPATSALRHLYNVPQYSMESSDLFTKEEFLFNFRLIGQMTPQQGGSIYRDRPAKELKTSSD